MGDDTHGDGARRPKRPPHAQAFVEHIEEGLAPKDAARKAMEELTGPVIGIALVLSSIQTKLDSKLSITDHIDICEKHDAELKEIDSHAQEGEIDLWKDAREGAS